MDENVKEDIPMIPLEPSEKIPLIPLEPSIPIEPSEPSEPVYYWIELEERGFVVGYGTSESTYQSIKYKISDMPEDFDNYFNFYRLDENLKLVYDRTRIDEILREQEEEANKPTKEELMEALLLENSLLKQEILEAKQRALMTEEAILDLATMIISV